MVRLLPSWRGRYPCHLRADDVPNADFLRVTHFCLQFVKLLFTGVRQPLPVMWQTFGAVTFRSDMPNDTQSRRQQPAYGGRVM